MWGSLQPLSQRARKGACIPASSFFLHLSLCSVLRDTHPADRILLAFCLWFLVGLSSGRYSGFWRAGERMLGYFSPLHTLFTSMSPSAGVISTITVPSEDPSFMAPALQPGGGKGFPLLLGAPLPSLSAPLTCLHLWR